MKLDEARKRFLEDADDAAAIFAERYLSNKGACFLTGEIPRPINVTLLPTPVSKAAYDKVVASQVYLNLLLDRASRDKEFVISSVWPTVTVDVLAKKLLEIYKECIDDRDQITLGSYRHDYMYNTPDPSAHNAVTNGSFKMVEANLMSAALLGIGTHCMDLHNQILGKNFPEAQQPYQRSLNGQIRGFKEAWKLYNRPNSIFLMLVAKDDFNWFDQQHMIDELWQVHGIISERMTYDEFMVEGKLSDNRYYVRGREVAIIYFRSMWNADHFKTEDHWKTRLQIEKSLAIKVPNIRHQVMNLKLFQQVFFQEGVMERYLEKDEAGLVRSTFTEVYNLAVGRSGDEAAELALRSPKEWVLKPSKEGGGNNIWEDEMIEMLNKLQGQKEREAFVLMRRLHPPRIPNRFIKNGPREAAKIYDILDTTTELGLFNVFVADKSGKVLVNEMTGPLLRTKPADAMEGGVAIGVGVMDSVVFYTE